MNDNAKPAFVAACECGELRFSSSALATYNWPSVGTRLDLQ